MPSNEYPQTFDPDAGDIPFEPPPTTLDFSEVLRRYDELTAEQRVAANTDPESVDPMSTPLYALYEALAAEFAQREASPWDVLYAAASPFENERIFLTPPVAPDGDAEEMYTEDVLGIWQLATAAFPGANSVGGRAYLSAVGGYSEPGTYADEPLLLSNRPLYGQYIVLANTPETLRVDQCVNCDTLRPYSERYMTCIGCMRMCEGCGGRENVQYMEDGLCEGCRERVYCDRCDESMHPDDAYWDDYNGVYLCSSHYRRYGENPGGTQVEQPASPEDDLASVSLLMDDMDGARTVRRVGLEIEGGGDLDGLAEFLHAQGVSPYSRNTGYHHISRMVESGQWPENIGWSVETDATVDWEAVSPVLDLTTEADASLGAAGVRAIAAYIEDGDAWHDYRAGLHIHVGTERLPIEASYRTGRLWMYLEDVIFRLSAAKWGAHRAIEQGAGYCEPIDKRMKTQVEFQRTIQRVGRYNALSFQNYLHAHMGNCSCGNCQFRSWDTCVCESLGKCTFEFRVFNATSNIKKVKAYVAFCVALVSYAERMESLDDSEWDERFPDLEFTHNRLRTDRDELYIERLNFIFDELPLTEDEKDALLYCVRESDLARFADSLNITNAEVVA